MNEEEKELNKRVQTVFELLQKLAQLSRRKET